MKKKMALIGLLLLTLVGCTNTETTNKTSNTTSPSTPPSTVPSTPPSTVPSTVPGTVPSTVPGTVPSTTPNTTTSTVPSTVPKVEAIGGYDYLTGQSESIRSNFDAGGFVEGKIGDFSQYEGTTAYVQVSTPEEFLQALVDAKYTYTNTWVFDTRDETEAALVDRLNELEDKRSAGTITKDENTERVGIENELKALGVPGHVEQDLKKAGTVHVIEIMNNLNMGFYTLDQAKVNTNGAYDSVIDDFSAKNSGAITALTMSDMFTENGMSQIKIENTSNLLVYSKNGAKLTHCGIKLTSDTNIAIRNLEFDELWQWEDSSSATPSYTIGDYDAFGWAYFKISNCGYVWIDHCTFGKSYDGQIDYSHPTYAINKSVCFRAPYGADGGNGLHISNCRFNAGSDDENGYIYQMMSKIKEDYEAGNGNYLYYNTLRQMGISHEEILYGIAIPQKKGFLLGDSGDEYTYNLEINVSFANNIFKNLEDRLPKIRGGIAYLYNNIVDSWQYNKYRVILVGKNAKNIGSKNAKYKCALVNQGIICGLGGSVRAEHNIYRGVDTLLKNNDSGVSGELLRGGFAFINMQYQLFETDTPYTSSTTKANHQFNSAKYNASTATLSSNYFSWHNDENASPFTPTLYNVADLEETLYNTCPVGVNKDIDAMYLYTKYSDYIYEG